MDQAAALDWTPVVQRLLQKRRASSHCPPLVRGQWRGVAHIERETRQPAMRLAKASMMKATYTKPGQVAT